MPARSAARQGSAERPASLVGLERRVLLSSFAWSAEEVFLVELINRARANPYGEEVIYPGLDLEADLHETEIARLVPQEPLALQSQLTLAARGHNTDMAVRDFFAHDNPDGLDPDARAAAQGYPGSAGENIAAGYPTIDRAHEEWLRSVGHRRNVLSLWTSFTDTFHYDEVGVAVFQPGPSGGFSFNTYYTEVFGSSGFSHRTWILGVVHDDTNGDDLYTIGEGRGSVRIDVALASAPDEILGTYTTDSAGNYQIQVDEPADYIVTFTDETSGLRVVKAATVAEFTNVKVDAQVSEFAVVNDPPANVLAAADALVTGATDSSGRLNVTAVNTDGRPIAFTQNGSGGWTASDLRDQAGGATLIAPVESFVNPLDDLHYAAAPSEDGLLLYRRSAEGVWTVRNLSEETDAPAVEGPVTVFNSLAGTPHIAGLDASGDLLLFTQGDQRSDGQFEYTSRNLTDSAFAPAGLDMPLIQGSLISYVTSWDALNVAALNAEGDIIAFWFHGSLSDWTISNLSDITGAPPVAGGLTAYLTSWGGINLAGTDASGELTVTWWVPSFGGDWAINNLTDQFGGPTLGGNSVTSYVTPWGGLNVAGLTSDGELTIYWWSPGLEQWVVSSISDLVPDAEPVTNTLRGTNAASTGATSVLGTSAAGEVLRYSWEPGGEWRAENLSELV